MTELVQSVDPSTITEMALTFAPKLLAAVLTLVGFWVVVRITRGPLRRILERADFDRALTHLLVDNVFRFAIMAVAIVMALGQVGLNVGAMVAGLGVAGIAIGFAAKDSLTNTIAGFLIFWDKPFRVGERISTQGQYGEVTRITMRTTRIRTPDNTFVVIPNSEIIEDVLVNHSINGDTRVVVPVGISYGSNIDEARRVLTEAVSEIDVVLDDPAPTVVVTELAGSSVNLGVRVWMEDAADEKSVFHEALERCKKALDAAQIEIPFPHLQLYVDGIKEPVWKRVAEIPFIEDSKKAS